MSGLFGGSKSPAPPPPPPPAPPAPTVDQARESRMEADEMRRRRGRASTILTEGGQGMLAQDQGTAQTATKTLLGG